MQSKIIQKVEKTLCLHLSMIDTNYIFKFSLSTFSQPGSNRDRISSRDRIGIVAGIGSVNLVVAGIGSVTSKSTW